MPGVLSLTFPTPMQSFGYGYAINTTLASDPIATSITLFDGATNLGTLSYTGTPDPSFTGGFAGIQSDTPFTSANVTFDSANAPAFAFDYVRFETSVPEPGSLAILGVGGVGLLGYWWCRRQG